MLFKSVMLVWLLLSIKCEDKVNHVQMFSKGVLILEYTDTILSDNSFIRKIGEKEMTIVDGEVKLFTSPLRRKRIVISTNSLSRIV